MYPVDFIILYLTLLVQEPYLSRLTCVPESIMRWERSVRLQQGLRSVANYMISKARVL